MYIRYVETNTELATVKCLFRDEQGLCEPGTVAVDNEGTPVTSDGYEYQRVGTTIAKGFGLARSGPCTVWESKVGRHSILIPLRSK